jgi:peptidylprolyl isomerase
MRRLALAAFALTTSALAASCATEAPASSVAATASAIPAPPPVPTPPVQQLLDASPASDWRRLDPENTLYMDFPATPGHAGGRVIIEMAPTFAPNHVANVKALSREGYFVNGAVTRVQDNFVAQWAQAAEPEREPKVGKKTLKAEFYIPRDKTGTFTVLPDPDTYAPEVGFVDGLPTARDADTAWGAHCYGVVGVGRDVDDDSGGGTELYAIIGQSPRNLDRQITVLGRVVQGMDILASLPRGTGDAGFYKTPQEYAHYTDIKVAADVPAGQRTELEVLRTDSQTFADVVNNRRWRHDDFYRHPVGRIGLCNITVPSRPAK